MHLKNMYIDFIKGQLRLNHSEILISNDSLTELKTTYEGNAEIVDFFKNFENLARKQEYLILDESSMREIPVASDIKTEGLAVVAQRLECSLHIRHPVLPSLKFQVHHDH